MGKMTYEEAMHELRKAHKGMRRLQRRLMIAEGLLGKIARICHTNSGTLGEWNQRMNDIYHLSWYAFNDVWKPEDCSKKLDEHLSQKRARYHKSH